MKYQDTWDLKEFFEGDIDSPEFAEFIKTTTDEILETKTEIDKLKQNDEYYEVANTLQDIAKHLTQASSFIGMWQAVNYGDERVTPKINELAELDLIYTQIMQAWMNKLVQLSPTDFEKLITSPKLRPVQFILQEQRREAKRLLDTKTEEIINRLQKDALFAWSDHYETIASKLNTTYQDEKGINHHVSAGQALNLLDSITNNEARANLMKSYEKMWGDVEALSSDTLNHLAGARLSEYSAHGINDFLERPLEINRMSRKTLDTMWHVVEKNKKMLVDFLNRKAKLLKLSTSKISWQDQSAPLDISGYKNKKLSYDDAVEIIIKNFSKFSPKMGKFAEYAFNNRWIEAADRPGKQPGGFETPLPVSKEARIFLTFTGSVNDAATIAHELGHGFHTQQMQDLPFWRQDYAMNVAETASTFAETIINNANIENARSNAEKLTLLDAKMVNATAMFMNIHARFLFETNFYTARKEKFVTASELDQMMVDAQRVAFAGAIDENGYHPHFWTSKLHFYISGVPFYNFPYTFGYLFSLGIYAFAKKHPDDFEDRYIALLRDTANMTVEELAKKHLGVDLTDEAFWQAGADLVAKDIADYMKLSEEFI